MCELSDFPRVLLSKTRDSGLELIVDVAPWRFRVSDATRYKRRRRVGVAAGDKPEWNHTVETEAQNPG